MQSVVAKMGWLYGCFDRCLTHTYSLSKRVSMGGLLSLRGRNSFCEARAKYY